MSKATAAYQEIELMHWNAAFSVITRDFRGSHGRLEVFGPEVNYQVETEGHPFGGIDADTTEGERTVWIHFDNLRHGIQEAAVVRIVPRIGGIGPVIEVETADGTMILLTLSAPEKYQLPPTTL